jgi:hypothetical protein
MDEVDESRESEKSLGLLNMLLKDDEMKESNAKIMSRLVIADKNMRT